MNKKRIVKKDKKEENKKIKIYKQKKRNKTLK